MAKDKFKQEITWTECDIFNPLPKGEVLAMNGRDMIYGSLYENHGDFRCESDDQCLERVTHYAIIPMPNFK